MTYPLCDLVSFSVIDSVYGRDKYLELMIQRKACTFTSKIVLSVLMELFEYPQSLFTV